MAANDHAPTVSTASARWVIITGLCLTAVGLLAGFQVERHGSVSTQDFEFRFLSDLLVPVFMLGLLTMLIGSVLWAWCATIRDLSFYGFGIVILVLALAFIPVHVNPHGWAMGFIPVGADGILVGGLFLILAAIRAVIQYRAKS
jgi:hypothetical protein